MIFPEIAFLWNVREGFEPSTSGQFMCTLLYHWATAHHAPIIWLSTQSQMDMCGFAPHIKALFVRIICAL